MQLPCPMRCGSGEGVRRICNPPADHPTSMTARLIGAAPFGKVPRPDGAARSWRIPLKSIHDTGENVVSARNPDMMTKPSTCCAIFQVGNCRLNEYDLLAPSFRAMQRLAGPQTPVPGENCTGLEQSLLWQWGEVTRRVAAHAA